jgi:glucan phosphoethanolaminetransferase (alkaline phosphatase superfamily)
MQPRNLILIGFVLLLLGFVIPFLIVVRVIPSTFFLNFLSYAASMLGLFLGMIGAVMYVRIHRHRN